MSLGPRPFRVLVVDDEAGVRDAYRSILEPSRPRDAGLDAMESALFGVPAAAPATAASTAASSTALADSAPADVVCVPQGRDALDEVVLALERDQPFSVAFVDMRMPPGWDGLVTAERIRAVDPAIQIVIVTAYSDHAWEEVVQRLGRIDSLLLLRKPFDVDEVRQMAAALGEKWRLARAAAEELAEARRLAGQLQAANASLEREMVERHAAEEQRRSLEEQLRHSQKMEALGQLAGGVAHDFNNLLTAILGFGHIVRSGLGATHRHAPDVAQILRAGQRAADLTRQLLAFGRRQVLEFTVLDLQAVVESVAPMLRQMIGESIELVTVAAADLGCVRADAGQVEQVLVNLVVNARDAMPAGGTVTIDVANVDVAERFDGHDDDDGSDVDGGEPGAQAYVMLAVTDTGVGMDEATRERLFEPFFTTKELGRGTGLGLATVYGIVRQCGGHVAVHSELGRGTTLRVYLPRIDAHPATEAAAPRETMPRGEETILLVEDESGVRALAETVLVELGYTVLTTSSGAMALERARTHQGRIDLVLTDVVMPGMGGREVVERLVAARPGIASLYMSGYTDDAIVNHGVLRHEVTFLQKPFTATALAAKVRAVIDRARAAARDGQPASPASQAVLGGA